MPCSAPLHYGFVTLPRDLAVSLLVGVLIAGVLAAMVPEKAGRRTWAADCFRSSP